MLEGLLMLVIYAMFIGVVAWLLIYLVDMLSPYMPAPIPQILRVIIIFAAVILILYLLLGLIGNTPRLGRL
jgi:H+/Cl- antiporter ClcA